MELDKLSKFEETKDPPLSGAYIHSLVKQLTTTKPKETMNTKDPCCAFDGSVSPNKNLRKHGKILGASNCQQQQQHKKQVRRRLHTTRPYQERLLNMAEVRREIVTALKFHRAAMKQASEEQQQQNHQQQQQQQQQQEPSVVSLHHPSNLSSFDQQDVKFKSKRNPRIYPSCTTTFPNDISYSSFSHPPLSVPTSFTSFAPPLLVENPNFTLPNQTLGLNLNLHDFNNLDTTLLLNNNNNNNNNNDDNSSNSSNTLDATLLLNNSSSNSSNTLDATLLLNNNNNNNNSSNSTLYSYSSSTSSSPPLSFVTDQEVPSIGKSQEGVSSLVNSTIESSATTQVSEGGFHTTMDDEGMEEMRSLGELYQMEWNDTMNLVTSTLWFNFLKNMDHDEPQLVKTTTEGDAFHHIFDELIEIPPWLNAKESCLEQCSEDYFQDVNLPW